MGDIQNRKQKENIVKKWLTNIEVIQLIIITFLETKLYRF